jgi:hypothetical protein
MAATLPADDSQYLRGCRFHVLVLPYTHHPPSRFCQLSIGVTIAGDVGGELVAHHSRLFFGNVA